VPTISGYAAGENVKIEYRWVETRYERLPSKGFRFRQSFPQTRLSTSWEKRLFVTPITSQDLDDA
jgi:hypothetical protein